MKKTWTDRLNDPKPHEVKPVPISIAGMKAGEIMLVPSASLVDAFIRTIPRGKGMDVKTLRQRLARKYRRSHLPDHDGLSPAHRGRSRLGGSPTWREAQRDHAVLARARRGNTHHVAAGVRTRFCRQAAQEGKDSVSLRLNPSDFALRRACSQLAPPT
jgi:hypothetical protein